VPRAIDRGAAAGDQSQAAESPQAESRIHALDAVRGLALCGILLVNIPEITRMVQGVGPGVLNPVAYWLELLVHQRFFPIFAFLFGLSFALFLDGAAKRTNRPRRALVRRLIALAVFGALHHLLQPGEALLPYAVIGVVVLLPASWLPRWLILAGGLGGTVAALALTSGGIALVPGLFLLGLATARYGVQHTLDRRGPHIGALFVLATVSAVVAVVWQLQDVVNSGFTRSSSVAGILLAISYTTGLLLLLRTRIGQGVTAVLAPLGRMALTNYVGATVIVLAAAPGLGLTGSSRWGPALALAAVILVVQSVCSRWWLSRYRYGPAEWCWRCLTWWSLVPNRRNGRTRR
jgi:uncharacterized protein